MDFEEDFSGAGLEGFPSDIVVILVHVGFETAAESGDLDVFDDVLEGFGGDFGVGGGEVFHAFGVGDEAFGGVGVAVPEAEHEGVEGAGFVDVSQQFYDAGLEVDPEHGVGEIDGLVAGDVAVTFGADDHAADGVGAEDGGALGGGGGDFEHDFVGLAGGRVGEGEHDAVEGRGIIDGGSLAEDVDRLRVADAGEEIVSGRLGIREGGVARFEDGIAQHGGGGGVFAEGSEGVLAALRVGGVGGGVEVGEDVGDGCRAGQGGVGLQGLGADGGGVVFQRFLGQRRGG